MRYAKYNIRNTKNGPRVTSHQSRINAGSALILTVVLTSLLAIVGVLFVMMARVNQIASSGLSESKELDSAVETVIAKISEELALDIPRRGPNDIELSEYYDYPGQKDKWLASLEPSTDSNSWRQISDVYNKFDSNALLATIVPDYQDSVSEGSEADADGDGVADSKWVELDDITSSKGRPVFAAIRIIDNGGMLNVNTAYMFDPNSATAAEIDGSSLMQINLAALAERGANGSPAAAADKLQTERCGTEPNDLSLYERNVVWRYDSPSGAYTPFDIGDELKLRNRYIISKTSIDTRISDFWEKAFDWEPYVPRNEKYHSITEPNDWFWYVDNSSPDANSYNYRHIATTYNMDRIINPYGDKMVNINMVTAANDVYSTIREALTDYDPNIDPNMDVNDVAAQIAVNLIDFSDNDSNVTSFSVGGSTYHGFERPCVYISELAHKFVLDFATGATYRSYAIELYKPYPEDNDPCDWRLVIDGGPPITIGNWTGGEQFYVIRDQNSNALLDVNLGATVRNATFAFTANTEIRLERPLPGGGDVTVDWYEVDPCIPAPWLSEDNAPHSVHRDIQPHKCIRRLWAMDANPPTLGQHNNFEWPDSVYIQAHPANTGFTNVGEVGMLFREDVYSRNWSSTDTEADVRLDLADPYYQNLFQYITVLDPASDGIDNDGDTLLDSFDLVGPEWKVPGRININTAPWYVIAQLPWMQYQDSNSIPFERAKAISDKRDEAAQQGFWNIGELMLVGKMQSLGEDGLDQVGFPDLTWSDGAVDDFEERDVIFARISNLVTVRSDVFTAYILVRIGTDGPQKRVIAILDRSDVYSLTDRVKIVAVHPVPDPR